MDEEGEEHRTCRTLSLIVTRWIVSAPKTYSQIMARISGGRRVKSGLSVCSMKPVVVLIVEVEVDEIDVDPGYELIQVACGCGLNDGAQILRS